MAWNKNEETCIHILMCGILPVEYDLVKKCWDGRQKTT